jgi:ribosomal protein S18 acetylase RimI-like enzyme
VRIKAETVDQIVGFVFGDRRRMRGLGWVASIGVHPDFRRRGIARMLLDACEVGLATPKLRLVLKPSNTAAKTLYMNAGYEEIDIWRRYYANGEDGLVMEKNSNNRN